jgi:hypothetical protein
VDQCKSFLGTQNDVYLCEFTIEALGVKV